MFEHIENLAWVVLLAPLIAAVVIGISVLFLGGNPRANAQLSIFAVVVSFISSLILFVALRSSGADALGNTHWLWLWIGDFSVDIGLRLDRLSLAMALIVTGVGGLIHIYSWGYMQGDRAYGRYFGGLSLFTFSMLGIVLSDNFVMMFIFWELVGVSSYLLIGHWYEKASAADACKKAFLTNRIGDFGFLLGILIVWATLGHKLNFQELKEYLETNSGALGAVATAAGVLIFCGAVGKSAQFPLHVWLPDAMEGPTPVSALIHAATMVAAGVYMLCRVFFLFEVPGSHALEVIAWTGGLTALFAAVVAIQQNDIKRILAYSTLSQLGYMVMAVGLSGPTAAMYHLTTHAFFKALLFLGAGAVILSLHHEQNIWKMGALRKRMPLTYKTFLAGTLALCGVPPLSGFYSKDGILAQALQHNVALFVIGLFGAMLTTFYMFRLMLVVFGGREKSEAAGHAHEAPGILAWPLMILAVPSLIGGFLGIQGVFEKQFEPGKAAEAGGLAHQLLEPFSSPLAAFFGLFAILLGLSMALALYWRKETDPLPEKLGWLSRAMRNRFYFDELYEGVLIPCTQGLAARLADALDRWLIGGAVRGVHGTTELAGRALRLFQTGSIQTYAFFLVLGVAVVLIFVLAH